MTQFRVSRALIRAGVSEPEQHIIFGECIKKKSPDEAERIHLLCEEVSWKYADALYRFVTDPYINHVYICLNYKVSKNTLFSLKGKFYKLFKDEYLTVKN